MIIVRMMGGLANQMFQYAAGRNLAEKHGTDLYLDLREYDDQPKENTPRHYDLGCFPILASAAGAKELAMIAGDGEGAHFKNKLFKRVRLDESVARIDEKSPSLQANVLRAGDNVYLVGYWQNQEYFYDIRDKLINEFTPKNAPNKKSQEVLDCIKQSNSVSIHVRRGDYVSNPNAKIFHGLATVDYYMACAKYLKSKDKNITFFVFSDDLEWCKNNLDLGKESIFVDANSDGGHDYEDMRLMSHCKHNIIANSSFSWWGAWLNTNPSKIVCAPKTWFLDYKANQETEIVPSDWKRF
jgi:hypothetical protein